MEKDFPNFLELFLLSILPKSCDNISLINVWRRIYGQHIDNLLERQLCRQACLSHHQLIFGFAFDGVFVKLNQND